MGKLLMPSLGSDMEVGTLIEWEKLPGDSVVRGDVVAVVETQKGAIEIEVFENGVLEEQLVSLGEEVPVGTALATIKNNAVVEAEPETPETPEVSLFEQATGTQRLRISPAARKRAQQLAIDVSAIKGSGPEGAVVLRDLGRPPAKLDVPDFSEMRKAIAKSMSHSKSTIPHYYLAHTIDLSIAQTWLSTVNSDREPEERILMAALLLKAIALAAMKYPEFNGRYENGNYEPGCAVHTGMAINLRGGGLIAPAIHNVNSLDLDSVMFRMRDLIARVKAGRFRAKELSDPTLTVSSLGERGVDCLYGVIHPPQVAIIGVGTPALKPWVDDQGNLSARMLVTMSIAADHRVSDGHRAGRFLNEIKKQLELPENL